MPCAIKIEDDKANYKLTFYFRQPPSSIVEVACERVSPNIVIHVNIIKEYMINNRGFLFVKMLVEICATNFELHIPLAQEPQIRGSSHRSYCLYT